MKIVIIEGPDNTGKNTIISNLIETNPISKIIHCGKPESSDSKKAYFQQLLTFTKYANIAMNDYAVGDEDVLIFNRFYQGEYVYGQMYRGGDKEKIIDLINYIEDTRLCSPNTIDTNDLYYVQLMSTSSQLLKNNDDAKSLSQAKLDLIEKEQQLFKEVFELSSIKKKKIIYVNKEGTDEFKTREEILDEFTKFINS